MIVVDLKTDINLMAALHCSTVMYTKLKQYMYLHILQPRLSSQCG